MQTKTIIAIMLISLIGTEVASMELNTRNEVSALKNSKSKSSGINALMAGENGGIVTNMVGKVMGMLGGKEKPYDSNDYATPTPSYMYPSSSYATSTPSYMYPSSSYATPTPSYMYPSSSYATPTPSNTYPSSSYATPTPSNMYPSSSYATTTPSSAYPSSY